MLVVLNETHSPSGKLKNVRQASRDLSWHLTRRTYLNHPLFSKFGACPLQESGASGRHHG